MPKRKTVFQKEIRELMYGFGDVANSLPDTINAMDECLEWFVSDLCLNANSHSQGRLKTADFLLALQGDAKKLSRAHELLSLDMELKQARSLFDAKELAKEKD